MRASLLGLMAATVLGTLALSPAAHAGPFEGPEFDKAMTRWIENNPEVVLKAINSYVERQKDAEAKQADDVVLKLASELSDPGKWTPVLGSKSGKIVLIEVIDANCVFCRRMEPDMHKVIADNPDLRVIRRYVPFLSPSSEYAARMASLVWRRHEGRYADFDKALMAEKTNLSTDSVDRIVGTVLGSEAVMVLKSELASGMVRQELDEHISTALELTHRAKINGTPFTMIVGAGRDGLFRGAVPAPRLQAAIDKARAASASK
jgi:protein-disulfide isomerase